MQEQRIPYAFDPDVRYPHYLARNGVLKGIRHFSPLFSGRLMDLGCGSKPYRSLFNVDEYIGVDYNSEGHPHDGEPIDVFYDGKTLPFPDEHFDGVFSSEVFEHIFNLEEILAEVHRVMKKGAKLLFTCPFVISEHEVPNDFARYTMFALRHMLEKQGFRVVETRKSSSFVLAIMQMRIMYVHLHLMPFVRKIPVVRSGLRFVVYTWMNLVALLLDRVFPKRHDFYLNNIVLCEKI
ncbi:class I SAM-dependent methyltransferase [Chitinophaga agrisoli]|uniref:Class I SAM-dependent methyltransferase n=1 Tax=Chitinophaga agrisoli TaxID=2607653 RepID=A0A5B2VKU8_9BACT|nr:class I SAM-dependent methyltransferase [Chitinophaga agrisoli]KAA2239146.1 class I SAM-dependent methyltransferase [Chitinophaga agrisoli]